MDRPSTRGFTRYSFLYCPRCANICRSIRGPHLDSHWQSSGISENGENCPRGTPSSHSGTLLPTLSNHLPSWNWTHRVADHHSWKQRPLGSQPPTLGDYLIHFVSFYKSILMPGPTSDFYVRPLDRSLLMGDPIFIVHRCVGQRPSMVLGVIDIKDHVEYGLFHRDASFGLGGWTAIAYHLEVSIIDGSPRPY